MVPNWAMPAVACGTESWILTNKMERELITWKRINPEKNIWANIRKWLLENKNELRNLYQFKSPYNVTVIIICRLEWVV